MPTTRLAPDRELDQLQQLRQKLQDQVHANSARISELQGRLKAREGRAYRDLRERVEDQERTVEFYRARWQRVLEVYLALRARKTAGDHVSRTLLLARLIVAEQALRAGDLKDADA